MQLSLTSLTQPRKKSDNLVSPDEDWQPGKPEYAAYYEPSLSNDASLSSKVGASKVLNPRAQDRSSQVSEGVSESRVSATYSVSEKKA